MHLKNLEDAEEMDGNIPCVLQKSARDGSESTSSPPGLLVSQFRVNVKQLLLHQ